MKKESQCPKCGSKDILFIPDNKSSNFIYSGKTNLQITKISLYICGTCGFTEHYVTGNKQLEKIKKKFG